MPSAGSKTTTISVTNSPLGFCSQSASLTRATTASGRSISRQIVRQSVIVTAMNIAAGTPLPETSPTTSAMRPSPSRIRS